MTGLSTCSVALAGYYHIGAALPFTGPLPVGDSMERAILQALRDINANGGIGGRSVGLVSCDSACDGTTATAVVTELAAASPISGILGPACSGATIPASAVAIREEIVMISPSATSPAISDIVDEGWLNRTAPSDALQGIIVAAIATRDTHSKVFVVNRDDPYGNGLRSVFVDAFEAGGGTANFISYDPETAGFADTVIDAAVADAPDAVFMISFTTDGAAIAQTAITRAFDPGAWIFPDGLRDPSFIEAVANDTFLEGASGTIPASPTGSDFTTFTTQYNTLYGEEPGPFGANIYDAAYLMSISMALATDADDRTQVRDGLANTNDGAAVHPEQWSAVVAALGAGTVDYEGASGAVDFDANGEVFSNVEEWTIRSGVIETVGCWTPDAVPCL